MLLAIDTSAGTSVAVVDPEGAVLAEESEADTRRHAEVVGLLLSRALANAAISPADVTAVVAGMGPGPFTGLRVGIAAARAFAVGVRKPVVPIVSHDAVAFGRELPSLVVTDARRREVAWSAYDAPGPRGLPVRRAGPALARPADLIDEVDGYASLERVDAAQISAGALGALAALVLRTGAATGPAEPLYLRAPDVTLAPRRTVTP